MKRIRVHLDSFSGSLGELPKGRRTLVYALAVLADDPRVSTFERDKAYDRVRRRLEQAQRGNASPDAIVVVGSIGEAAGEQQAGDGYEVLTVSAGSPKPPAWADEPGEKDLRLPE